MGAVGRPFLATALGLGLVSLVLLLTDFLTALGYAILGLAAVALLVGVGLSLSALVSWWVSRDKPFA
jgi:hypothetical protein